MGAITVAATACCFGGVALGEGAEFGCFRPLVAGLDLGLFNRSVAIEARLVLAYCFSRGPVDRRLAPQQKHFSSLAVRLNWWHCCWAVMAVYLGKRSELGLDSSFARIPLKRSYSKIGATVISLAVLLSTGLTYLSHLSQNVSNFSRHYKR